MDNIVLHNILVSSTSKSIKKAKLSGKLELYDLHILSLFGKLLNDFNTTLTVEEKNCLEGAIRTLQNKNDYICNTKSFTSNNILNVAPIISNTSLIISNLTYNFKELDFNSTFSDINNNKPYKLKILSLPTNNAVLTYDDNIVSMGDEILLTNITNLLYTRTDNTSSSDLISFKLSDNNTNNPLFSNIGNLNITVEEILVLSEDNTNNISVNDIDIDVENLKYSFSSLNFLKAISIDKQSLIDDIQITSLPTNGLLYYINELVVVNDIFNIQEAGFLNYKRNNDTDTSDTLNFKVNTKCNNNYSNESIMTLNLLEIEDVNIIDSPLVLTNINVTVPTRKYPFKLIDFLQGINSNNIDKIKNIMITTLPTKGSLSYHKQIIPLNTLFNIQELCSIVYKWTDFNNNTDALIFKVNTKTNETYSNMATMTLNITDSVNLPPSQVGVLTLNIDNSTTYTFTSANFTTETTPVYLDPEGDDASNIKITLLPTKGLLYLDGDEINLNQIVNFDDIISGKLQYVSDASNQTAHTDLFNFSISDKGSETFTSGGIMTISIAEYINQAPTVGDSEMTIDEGDIITFTRNNFLIDADPDYADAENDAPIAIRFPTLPSSGLIKLNNVYVTVNQEIVLTDIDSGLLTYTQASNAGGTTPSFTFNIKDSFGNWSS